MIIQGIRYASDFEAKKLMIETGRDLDEKGYTLAQDGSMSVRVGPNMVWVTKDGSENGELTQGDFIRVDLNGKSMNHSPDAVLPEDLEIHLKIYRENAQIQGIVHAYPVCAVILQQCPQGLEACSYTPAVRSLGRITLVPAGDIGQVTAACALAAHSDKGVLLEGDGCLMWGESVREAYRSIRLLDYCAKVRSMSGGCCREDAGALDTPAPVPQAGSAAGSGISGLTGLYHPAGGSAAKASSPSSRGSVAAGSGISGLTGLYHPAGGSAAKASAPSSRGSVAAGSGISGLTGLYHPAGGSAAGTAAHVSQAGFTGTISRALQGGVVKTAAVPATPPAQPDPVRERTVSEVVRRSMKKMGKGGL